MRRRQAFLFLSVFSGVFFLLIYIKFQQTREEKDVLRSFKCEDVLNFQWKRSNDNVLPEFVVLDVYNGEKDVTIAGVKSVSSLESLSCLVPSSSSWTTERAGVVYPTDMSQSPFYSFSPFVATCNSSSLHSLQSITKKEGITLTWKDNRRLTANVSKKSPLHQEYLLSFCMAPLRLQTAATLVEWTEYMRLQGVGNQRRSEESG